MKDKKFPYETTTDYEQMFDLITEGQTLIALFPDIANKIKRVCEVRLPIYNKAEIYFGVIGNTFLSIENVKKDFIEVCKSNNIQFIKTIF